MSPNRVVEIFSEKRNGGKMVNGKDLFVGDLAMLQEDVLVPMINDYNNDTELDTKSLTT